MRLGSIVLCLIVVGGAALVWWMQTSSSHSGPPLALSPEVTAQPRTATSTSQPDTSVAVAASAVSAAPEPSHARGSGETGTYDAASLERVLSEALANPQPDERRLLLRGLAEFLAKHAPGKATSFLDAIMRSGTGSAESDGYVFVQAFADTLAARDPQAAARWGNTVPERLKDVVNQFTARHWAASDPQAATEWMRSVADPALRATIVRALGQQLAQSDPNGYAPRWAAELARGPDGSRFSDLVVSFWAKSDAPAAWEWVRSLENNDDREQAVLAFAGVTAQANPEQTLAWVRSLSGAAAPSRAVLETVNSWARREPARAAAWVDAHAGIPGLVTGSAHAIATSWFQTDRVSAARWLETAQIPAEMKQYFLAMAGQAAGPR